MEGTNVRSTMTTGTSGCDADGADELLGARIDALVADLSTDPRLAFTTRTPARPARLAEPERPLHPLIAERLGDRPLWSHQARAIDLIRDRSSIVLATPTASGKSLCYQVPAAEAALERHASTLMVFPTKALAQDQLRTLTNWELPGVLSATYDGDCTPQERSWVRSNADMVLTNPEMLHHGILPNHSRWATFLHRLELVVVDELHVLRGVFGTHTAQVLRRLRRLAESWGVADLRVHLRHHRRAGPARVGAVRARRAGDHRGWVPIRGADRRVVEPTSGAVTERRPQHRQHRQRLRQGSPRQRASPSERRQSP